MRVDLKDTYGHAFALPRAEPRSTASAGTRTRPLRWRPGASSSGPDRSVRGVLPVCAATSPGKQGGRTQNPLMHMFEAVQALHPRPARGSNWREAAGDFAVYKLLQGPPEAEGGGGARIPEWYDDAWQPAHAASRWLISTSATSSVGPPATTASSVVPLYAPVAERVLAYALQNGWRRHRRRLRHLRLPDGGKPGEGQGWWQQAECHHTPIVCARHTGRNDLWRR